MLYKKENDLSSLRSFGSQCFPYTRPYVHDKLKAQPVECVFLGYCAKHKSYICFDWTNTKYFVSRHIVCNEVIYPFKCTLVGFDMSHTFLEASFVLYVPTWIALPSLSFP